MDNNRPRRIDPNRASRSGRKTESVLQNKKVFTLCVVTVTLVGLFLGALIAKLSTRPANTAAPEKITENTVKDGGENKTAPATETEAPVEPTQAPTPAPVERRGTAEAIPEDIRQQMAGKSMPSGASVSYDQLSYLTIPMYDFNYNVTKGHLIVNKSLAEEVLDIFAELFDAKYPIQEMSPIDKYNADDFTSIDHNNTSSFCYRNSTSGSGKLSMHAYGRAIDINPQINPYVNGRGTGSHENAREYWSRDTSKWTSDIAKAAYIGPGTKIYDIFTSRGWTWGGNWTSYRDYQHFEK